MAASPSVFYHPIHNATPHQRLRCLLLNFVNQPELLTTAHYREPFQDTTPQGFHFTMTISMNHPTERAFLTCMGLHLLPNFGSVRFEVRTENTTTSSHEFYTIVAKAWCEDIDHETIARQTQWEYEALYERLHIGWACGVGSPDLTPVLVGMVDWKCMVELLKYAARNGPLDNILVHQESSSCVPDPLADTAFSRQYRLSFLLARGTDLLEERSC